MFNFLIGAITYIPAVTAAFVLAFVALGTSLLAALGAATLQWVIGGFTDLSYTNPATNPLIAAGLDITQGLVNLILVLVLIYIAIATILRLEGHQTKKLLVNFVIVALLVNFSPVICGVIVDAANILMNFFLQQNLSAGQQIVNTWQGLINIIFAGFKWQSGFDLGTAITQASLAPLEVAMSLMALSISNIVIFLVLFLFAFIFIARYIAIWILVILSPIAFAFRILPITKKYWDMWWTQFIQWTTIGLTAGFFLFLAGKFTSMIGETAGIIHQVSPGKVGSVFLPSIVPIVFYIIALMASVQTSAMGAQAVMGIAKTSGKWLGRKAGGRMGRTLEDKFRLKERVKKAVSAVDKSAGKRFGTGKLVRWAMPDMARKYGENLPAIEELKKKFSSESSMALMDGLTSGRFAGIEAAAALAIIKDRGDGEDIMQAYMRKLNIDPKDDNAYDQLFSNPGFTKDRHLLRAMDVLDGAGMMGKAIRNEPRLAAVLAGTDLSRGKYKNKTPKEVLRDYMGQTKNTDISGWEKEVPMHHEAMETFMGLKNEDAYVTLGGLKGGVPTPLKTFDENYSEEVAKWVTAGEVDADKLRRQLDFTPLEKKIELQPGEEGNERREKEVEGLNKQIAQRNKKIEDYNEDVSAYKQEVNNKYFNQIEDQYGVKRGELGYRKALKNERFTSKGWRLLEYGGGGGPSPGTAAMGGVPTPPTPPTPSTSTPGRRPGRGSTPPPGRRAGGGGAQGSKP
jgi:hypothetical protein